MHPFLNSIPNSTIVSALTKNNRQNKLLVWYVLNCLCCMYKCPKCFMVNYVKNGVNTGVQRYKCKNCGCQFTQDFIGKYGQNIKLHALKLYQEGLGINSIARFLKISQQIVSYWIKKYGNIIQQLKANVQSEYDVIEVHELCTFLKNGKIKSGYGLFTTDQNGGVSQTKTRLLILTNEVQRRLFEKIMN